MSRTDEVTFPWNPRYVVDGLEHADPESNYAGDGQFPPFRIFVPQKQDYIGKPYDTRQEAESMAYRLLVGDVNPSEIGECIHDGFTRNEPTSFRYKNYRGELSDRRVFFAQNPVWFGSTEWHPEPTWLLKAFDIEKQEWRDFKLADCDFLSDGLVKSVLDREAETTRRHDDRGDKMEKLVSELQEALRGVLVAHHGTPAEWFEAQRVARSLLVPSH